MKPTFIHLLRRMTMLIHYVDINKHAFNRLLESFERRSKIDGVALKFHKIMAHRYVFASRCLEEELIPATYKLFADYYEHGDIDKARVALLAKLTEEHYERSDAFYLGIKGGVVIMLIVVVFAIITRSLQTEDDAMTTLAVYEPIYRCTGLLLVWLWLYAAMIMLLDEYRVSWVFVFQLNPRLRLTHFQVCSEAANMSIVYLLNALMLITHSEAAFNVHVNPLVYPISLFLYFVLKLFTPSTVISYWHTRKTLLESFGQILLAPMLPSGKIRFRDGYIADVLTSMVKVLVDVAYSGVLCLAVLYPPINDHVLASVFVPLICCLPLWLRFAQCLRRYYDTQQRWPHLANAIKYAIAHSVVIISSFHPSFTDRSTNEWQNYRLVWLCSATVSTLYTFIWDVWQDWGLLQWNSSNWFLREQLLYETPAFYYWAIASNFVLRFVWVLTLVPFNLESLGYAISDNSSGDTRDVITSDVSNLFREFALPLLVALELFRRFQWSLLRIEWEHLCNGSGFRLAYYVPMFFTHSGNKDAENNKQTAHSNRGVMTEVAAMVIIVLIVAILAALL